VCRRKRKTVFVGPPGGVPFLIKSLSHSLSSSFLGLARTLDSLRSVSELGFACSQRASLRRALGSGHFDAFGTASDPAHLHTYVYLYMKRKEEECCYFRTPGLKRTFG